MTNVGGVGGGSLLNIIIGIIMRSTLQKRNNECLPDVNYVSYCSGPCLSGSSSVFLQNLPAVAFQDIVCAEAFRLGMVRTGRKMN